jgi:uncharacterized tellurite resistance protein B-like protein
MNEKPLLDGTPKLSDDALVCRFIGFGGQPKSVIMDRATRMIHFQNCHVPSTFLPVAAQPWFSSPFNGLIAAHEYRRRKGKRDPLGLIIVTHAGKATIPTDATNYELLRERMAAYSRNFGKDNPEVFGNFAAVGGFVGIFLAWSLTPLDASKTTFILAILGGACVGVLIPFAILALIHRSRVESTIQRMQESKVASTTASRPSVESIHLAVFDLLCCVMVADGRVSTREKEKTREIMSKVDIHWTDEEFDNRVATFIEEIRKQGYFNVVQRSIRRLPLFKQIGREKVLIKCIDLVAIGDGKLDPREKDLCDRIREVIGPIDQNETETPKG